MFCTRVAWVSLVCLLLCKEEGSSPVSFAITDRNDMACMRCHCLCPFGWYYVGVKSSFQHAREECESKRTYVF